MIELDDDVKEFLTQVNEDLEKLDRDLIELEKNPTDDKLLGQIFRAFHTIKGDCGFFGFSKLGSIVHASENLLSCVREGKIGIHADIITALLNVLDAVRQILHQIETTGEQGDQTYSELKTHLNQLKEGKIISTPLSEPKTDVVAPTDNAIVSVDENNSQQDTEMIFSKATPEQVINRPIDNCSFQKEISEPLSEEPINSPQSQKETSEPVNDEPINGQSPSEETPTLSDTIIRVDVQRLEKLMNLVGELVLTRNQILQLTSGQEHTGLLGASQRLNLITSELQEGIMKTRMQPIKKLWDKFPRLVRDLSIACKKKVILKMEGEETELDKTLIETISDPLMHIVRNAIDHGLESSQERIKQDKTAEGHLFLRAYHESGKVNIEVSDDGRGIEPERLRDNAIQRGILKPAQAKQMGDKELFNLLFQPGFSTAQQVSQISGRGVGLDVVKSNIDRIGGMIDLQSLPREGTRFKFKLPLTLAIVPTLIVKSCGDSYAIPQVSLVELVRLKGDNIKNKIEWIHNAPVYRLRGKLLPLVYLNKELKLTADCSEKPLIEQTDEKSIHIIVLQAEDRQFGLVVDEVNDTQEIVVKPLGKQLKGLRLYAGATILGDGKVALILDIMALSQSVLVMSEGNQATQLDTQQIFSGHKTTLKDSLESVTSTSSTDNAEMLLVFQVTEKTRMAIPLSLVTRLEKFPSSKVECSGHQHVIQYREQILPLIYLTDVLNETPIDRHHIKNENEMLQVVVYSTNERRVGLVVPRILDIVEENITIKNKASRKGVLYSTVIQGQVTELLDMEEMLKIAMPSFFEY
jgi:two-component system chemotaxis sensor kinase CheA